MTSTHHLKLSPQTVTEIHLDKKVLNPVYDHLETLLFDPLNEFLNRPSKRIRAQCVQLGFDLSTFEGTKVPQWKKVGSDDQLKVLKDAIEAIHSGSLIVDDIQDGSLVRRDRPTLHSRIGLPLALNAGNWLYFEPLTWVESLQLPPDVEVHIHRAIVKTLSQAHCGQALDLGIPMHELKSSEVSDICRASLELKTGALMSLALELGGLLGGASPGELENMKIFGKKLGVGLQMFDDLGNVTSKFGSEKQWEDFRLNRPTFIWSVAGRRLSTSQYNLFLNHLRALPSQLNSGADVTLLEFLKTTGVMSEAIKEASETLSEAMRFLHQTFPSHDYPKSYAEIENIYKKLRLNEDEI